MATDDGKQKIFKKRKRFAEIVNVPPNPFQQMLFCDRVCEAKRERKIRDFRVV